MKKIAVGLLIIGVLGTSSLVAYKRWQSQKLEGPPAPESTSWESIQTESLIENTSESTSENKPDIENKPHDDAPESTEAVPSQNFSLPEALNIQVSFYSQAPFSNWDYPWQEACEEASIALVANLYLEKNWTREEFNAELLRLVDWQMERFGAYEHTTVAQTVQMIESNYGLQTKLVENPSFEDLQKSIQSGHLIVAPFAGKKLNNPNFSNGGPVYHMLVIKGYDANTQQVVTHDVGTRNGEDYVYDWSVIREALHDWHDENIEWGTAQWIEVLPPTEAPLSNS